MGSDGVVVGQPQCQGLAGMNERDEQGLVQQLIAQTPIEALDKGILLRLAWRDVVPLDPLLLRPAQDRHAGELGTIVGDDHGWPAADRDESIELTHDAQPR